jgi:hypothetical protein
VCKPTTLYPTGGPDFHEILHGGIFRELSFITDTNYLELPQGIFLDGLTSIIDGI